MILKSVLLWWNLSDIVLCCYSVHQNWIQEISDALSTEDNSTEFNPLLVDNPTNNTDFSDATAATSDSSESSSSETSEASDSGEIKQIKSPCVNGTQSCESSEEYFFQDIGDDGHFAVDHLMVPDDDDRELSLRR